MQTKTDDLIKETIISLEPLPDTAAPAASVSAISTASPPVFS